MRYYCFSYNRARLLNLREQRYKQDTQQLIQSPQKPPKSDIKKYLKIVVDLSNTIQDENNKL